MSLNDTTKRNHRFIDLTGQRFGRLIVIEEAPKQTNPNNKTIRWLCRCDCGNTAIVNTNCLRSGQTHSCGCYQRQRASEASKTHGLSKATEYQIWCNIRSRCYKPNNVGYADYGGRGITVCDRWLFSFDAFYADMGPRPSLMHSIDRIDNNGPYSPSNCRWATIGQQCDNRRSNVLLTYNGKTMTATQWAEELGLVASTVFGRAAKGLPVEDILFAGKLPSHKTKGRRNP